MSWGWWMLQFGTPIILLVGVPGNIVSLLVMKSQRFSGKSYTHYLSALAVFDSLVLVGKYLRRIDSLLEAIGTQGLFVQYGDPACKVHNFSEHVCFLMSSWLVLCMTFERYIAVVFPFKKDTLCRPKNAVAIILLVFIIMSFTQIFRLVIIEKDFENGICTPAENHLHVYIAMHIYMYQLVLQFMLPALLIFICNITILYKIRRLRHDVRRNGGDRHQNNQNRHQNHNKTTGMLLIVSFTYIVTLLPLVLLSLIMHVAMAHNPMLARYLVFKLNDVRYLFELLSEVNYGVNFYIYVLSGAQFRYQIRYICSQKYSFISSGQVRKVFQFRKSAST